MKRSRVVLGVALIISVLALGLSCISSPAPAPPPAAAPKPAPAPAPAAPKPAAPPKPATAPAAEKPPLGQLPADLKAKLAKVINLGTFPVGGASMISTVAMGEAAGKELGVVVKGLPYSSELGRFKALESGEVSLITVNGVIYMDYFEGILDYKGWQPRKLRNVWYHWPTFSGIGVAPDAKSIADLKGRRWAYPMGSPGHIKAVASFLAFGGVDAEKMVKVPSASYIRSIQMVAEGAADVAIIGTTTPEVIEAVSAGKMKILPLGPPEEKEAWARQRAISPTYAPGRTDSGALKNNPLWLARTNYAFMGFEETSDDLIYALAYAFHKTYPQYKTTLANVTDEATLANTLDLMWWQNIPVAYHPGAVRYFKDVGAWTAQLEAYQQQALIAEARVHDVRQAWLEETKGKK